MSDATNIAATESAMMISADRQRAEIDRHAEDREEEADQQIDRDLGRGRGEERGRPGRRIGIGIRQPGMQREQRELQADADRDECQRRDDGSRLLRPCRREARRHVHHVEACR